MGELIDLTSDDFPECKDCPEPSKRVIGKTFDLEGRGQVGSLYHCENKQCNALRLGMIRAMECSYSRKEANHE